MCVKSNLHTEELYCGIANGRLLTTVLYKHRHQKLLVLHLFIDLFPKNVSPRYGISS